MDQETTARRALDRLMIREVIDSYGAHYDEQRMDEFEALFTDDAVLDFEPDPGFFPLPLVGKETIGRHMRERNAEVSKTAQRRSGHGRPHGEGVGRRGERDRQRDWHGTPR